MYDEAQEDSYGSARSSEQGTMEMLTHNVGALAKAIEVLHETLRPVLRESEPSENLQMAKPTFRSDLYNVSQDVADLHTRVVELTRRIDL